MDNLSRVLSEIAWGLDEKAGALSDDGEAAIAGAVAALRDYAGQMRAVAEATAPDGAVAWTEIDGEIGVDLVLEPGPLIRIVVGPHELNDLTRGLDIEPAIAISRALRWAPEIQQFLTALCSAQVRSVMATNYP